jgi:hypothetical protein
MGVENSGHRFFRILQPVVRDPLTDPTGARHSPLPNGARARARARYRSVSVYVDRGRGPSSLGKGIETVCQHGREMQEVTSSREISLVLPKKTEGPQDDASTDADPWLSFLGPFATPSAKLS